MIRIPPPKIIAVIDIASDSDEELPGASLQGKSDSENVAKENQELKAQLLCKICMDANVKVTFSPCGHLVCCQCAAAMKECPFCRQVICEKIEMFL